MTEVVELLQQLIRNRCVNEGDGGRALSQQITPERYWSMFHGYNERIDVESLDLSITAFRHVVQRLMT